MTGMELGYGKRSKKSSRNCHKIIENNNLRPLGLLSVASVLSTQYSVLSTDVSDRSRFSEKSPLNSPRISGVGPLKIDFCRTRQL